MRFPTESDREAIAKLSQTELKAMRNVLGFIVSHKITVADPDYKEQAFEILREVQKHLKQEK